MTLEPISIIGLLLWGTLVGVDLVTAPQGLFSRPLVAATAAGLIAGYGQLGLVAGIVLELYALDVLPIGASRYPDFGLGAVAAGAAVGMAPASLAPAMAGLVGLPIALLGGWSLHKLRRRNAVSIQRRLERVAAGDARAIWELQRNGFLRDALRSVLVTIVGLALAWGCTRIPWGTVTHAEYLSYATIAGGIAAVSGGAVRSAGAGARRRWLVVGLAMGVIVVLLQ